MRYFIVFVLGVSLTVNAMLLITDASTFSLAGIDAPRVERSEKSFPATLNNEVIEMLRTHRILNALAFLSALGLTGNAVAQDAGSTDLRMNATAEAVYHDNMKNTAAAAANGLALLSGTRSASLAIAEQNAASHQQAMNQLSAKMIAQTTITGATEGASAISTVRASDLMALFSQVIGASLASGSSQ